MLLLETSQRIYEEALKHGYVNYRSIIGQLTGIAGTGKTSLKELLFNRPPPPVRNSTRMAEAPIRATCCIRVDATGGEWKAMDEGDPDQYLADEMVAVSQPTGETPPETAPLQPDPQQHSTDLPVSSPSAPTSGSAPTEVVTATESPDLKASSKHSDPDPVRVIPKPLPLRTQIVVDDKFLRYIASSSHRRRPRNVDMLYLVDTGGQPLFHAIHSLFLGLPDFTIFVINLAHRLDFRPMIGYYENGKPLSEPTPSPLSHLEVLQHTSQALRSQALALEAPPSQASPLVQDSVSPQPSATDKASGPAMLVVGTHRDKELRFKETRAEKNERLASVLNPHFREQLVYYGESTKEVIFPLNARKPGQKDHIVAREIRKAVEHVASTIEPKKTPMSWEALERNMQHEATRLGRAFLTRKECVRLARKVGIADDALDVALDHLTRLHVVFYFREALPDIIFVRCQALLDKLSELVRRHYQLHSKPSMQAAVHGEWTRFRDKGLVSLKLLQKFPKHYVREADMFTPSHLVQLLLHRLVAVRFSDDEYFMPFVLPQLPQVDLDKHRVPPSSSAAPLAITLSTGVVPSGLFPALTVSLLSPGSPYSLRLLPSPNNRGCPDCVHRNCVKFQLPPGVPGALTLIDAFSHIEAHVDAPEAICSKHCPLIKQAIFDHIGEACVKLRFSSLSPQAYVLCESTVPHGEPSSRPFWHGLRSLFAEPLSTSRHHAEVSVEDNTWKCPLAPAVVHGEMEERHLHWFRDTEASAGGCTQEEGLTVPLTSPGGPRGVIDDQNEETSAPPSSSAAATAADSSGPSLVDLVKYVKTTKVYVLGLFLDVAESDLDDIERDHRLDTAGMRMAVLRRWKRECERPTWQAVVKAMREIGEETESQKLEEIFCTPTPSIYH